MNAADRGEPFPQFKTIFLLLFLAWSIAIAGFVAWSYWHSYTAAFEIARASAYESFSKDLVYRRWATMHGGVYVPITERTPPNPYLSEIPERDISTPSGRKLTLINPAYMTRQVHELASGEFGSKGHITSLKPMRPENAPDAWEAQALRAFERGEKEVSSIEEIGGDAYMRYMRPLIAESGCLKCHGKQGYKAGEIRGGLSVSVPWGEYEKALHFELLAHATGYGAIWALGVLGLGVGRSRIKKNFIERRQAMEVLRQSEERHRTILETAMDGFWVTDMQGRLIEVNEAYCRMSGYSAQELLAMRVSDVEANERPADVAVHMATLVEKGTDRFETRHRRKDGSLFFARISAQYRPVDGGQCVVFMQDVTEYKRQEQALRQLNEELDQRIQQRTRELEEANRELESFSYSVSHDLRAPLRAIEGYSGLLVEEYAAQLDARGKDYFKRVRGGVVRMGNLIDDLLKLSRISRQEIHHGQVNLSALALEAADELQSAEPERKVEWSIAPEVHAQGDSGLLRIVLQNLVGNAWKYSSKREVARIEFGVTQRNGRRAHYVRDNGEGFDMAGVGRLFQAFQRLHSPAEFPGSGIGLATVRRIILRHHGSVGAESKLGEGATFYFTL